jgi:hypothetical protein
MFRWWKLVRPANSGSAIKSNKRVYAVTFVWHTCGDLGHSIPWGKWMAHGVYPYPTDRQAAEALNCNTIHIYSISSQLHDSVARKVMQRQLDSGAYNHRRFIEVDQFRDVTGSVDWDAVLSQILGRAVELGI